MKKPGLELLACISALVLLSASCNDEGTPLPPDPRDKLTGVFEMTKLENGQTYTMKVKKVGELCNNFCDSLKYTNYGDLFSFTKVRTPSSFDTLLNIGITNPAVDKNSNRWILSPHGNANPPYNHNVIYNDSIKITFKISNVQYYQEDGIPFWDTVFTHVGVRIADIE